MFYRLERHFLLEHIMYLVLHLVRQIGLYVLWPRNQGTRTIRVVLYNVLSFKLRLCLRHLPNEFPEQPLRRTMATMTAAAAEFSCIVMRNAPRPPFLRSPRSVQQEDFFVEVFSASEW